MAFERVWNNANSYGFSGRRNESKMGPVSYHTPYKFVRLVSGSETAWIHISSGPENKSKMGVVSYQTLYKFTRLLSGFETMWLDMFVWARRLIEDGCCELSDTSSSYMTIERLWNNMKSYGFSGPGDKSKMGLVSYQTFYISIWLFDGSETVWLCMFCLGPEIKSKVGPVSYHTRVFISSKTYRKVWSGNSI